MHGWVHLQYIKSPWAQLWLPNSKIALIDPSYTENVGFHDKRKMNSFLKRLINSPYAIRNEHIT